LRALQDAGHFRPERDVVVPYRITTGDHELYGVWTMVATDEISDAVGVPGRVIRNEDVFAAKVRERLQLTRTIGHLISAVLLVQTTGGSELVGMLRDWCAGREPAGRDVDEQGQTHEIWVMPAGPERDRLLGLIDAGELIVADGNHRSLAAQQAGLPAFLAVVTAAEAVVIRPYNRLLRSLPDGVSDLPAALGAAGFDVTGAAELRQPTTGGAVAVYAGGHAYDVTLPAVTTPGAIVVDRLDHTVVERALMSGALRLAPDDERIAYVGGDYGVDWLRSEVDAGRAAAAILIAPVTTDDFVRVNTERMTMPRKSTWFTPKARAGLVLAEL
jgi:uncharacterized protein (DUF1015 family)